MSRTFTTLDAVRRRVPLIVALFSPAGGGKTYTALELATGIQRVYGKSVHVVDTESGRATHYSDFFTFKHTPFSPPFSPLDYLEMWQHIQRQDPGVVIWDQMSSEHDGAGGVLEWHEAELDRMAGSDWKARERMKFAGWIKPKAARRQLVGALVQTNIPMIFLFRAKEGITIKRGEDPKPSGFMPIGADEFVFEATVSLFLPPKSNGSPVVNPELPGERMMTKIPRQFENIIKPGLRLNADIGEQLAKWAIGEDAPKKPAAEELLDADALLDIGRTKAAGGMDALRNWWSKELSVNQRKALGNACPAELKTIAEGVK